MPYDENGVYRKPTAKELKDWKPPIIAPQDPGIESREDFLAKAWIILAFFALAIWLSLGHPGVSCGGNGDPCRGDEDCYEAIEDTGRFGQ